MSVITDLIRLQHDRAVTMKSRVMAENRLRAVVAGELGYRSAMKEADRKKLFKEADALIAATRKGKAHPPCKQFILASQMGIDALCELQHRLEEPMRARAAELPVAKWVEQPEQRGFGLLFLAIVIGEAGDLSGYARPCKLWKRFGCAPWTFNGQTQMGSTWKSGKKGKLPAEEWSAFGYSPRRRSIAFLIGQNMKMQNFVGGKGYGERADEIDLNFAGPYRQRFEQAKASFQQRHPDASKLQADRHGMLCAAKRVLLNLWVQWRRENGDTNHELERDVATLAAN
jgi:hypothetical protein